MTFSKGATQENETVGDGYANVPTFTVFSYEFSCIIYVIKITYAYYLKVHHLQSLHTLGAIELYPAVVIKQPW